MNDIKLEPFEDYETVKKKAEDYINRILFFTDLLKHRFGNSIKLTVFMSGDIMEIIGRGAGQELIYNAYPRTSMVCGYNVKLAVEKNTLFVGCDLL